MNISNNNNNNNNNNNIALIFRGGISYKKYRCKLFTDNLKLEDYDYITPCYQSVIDNIIKYNNITNYDVYIHCWVPCMKDKLINLYNPKKYLFEYQDHSMNLTPQTWQALSIKKSLNLIDPDISYNRIISLRPDILFFTPIDLSNNYRDYNSIYTSQYSTGDLYFIFNHNHVYIMKTIYDKIISGNLKPVPHRHIKEHVINCKEKILGDGLDSNKDTMLLWKYTLWKYGGKSLL